MKKENGRSQWNWTSSRMAERKRMPVAAAASVPSSSTSTKAFWMTSDTSSPTESAETPEKSAAEQKGEEGRRRG